MTDANEHVRNELQRLELLLHREVLRLRAAHLLTNNDWRGLYVSDDQVASVLREGAQPNTPSTSDLAALATEAERLRVRNAENAPTASPLVRLAELFGLDDFEREVLLLALAPELDLRYELLYSYLHNDVTRKRPTVDLALRVFCPKERGWDARRSRLASEGVLFRSGLLRWLPESAEAPASSLARSFCLPPRLLSYVLGLPGRETQLAPYTESMVPQQARATLPLPDGFLAELQAAGGLLTEVPLTAAVLIGHRGAGKQGCAEALATDAGRRLLVVDVERLMAASGDLAEAFMLLGREQRLYEAGVYLRGAEAFFDHDGRVAAKARDLAGCLDRCLGPLMMGAEDRCDWRTLLGGVHYHVFRLPTLPFALRRETWRRELDARYGRCAAADVDSVAKQFVLTPGQIRDAVSAVHTRHRLHGELGEIPTTGELLGAARAQSAQQLRSLAQPIDPRYTWEDLVLPPAVMSQLHEIGCALQHRHVVYGAWGFEARLSLGKGLKALFAGPSGTGKTMAAEVLAHELGLDLYKIDLAGVVSKYIGETEKNLDKIFRAAQCSNAILFFDEADALFGKRTVAKDAHDRYANIEVAYLLQKTEEYDGFVILATNLIQNMDEAFKRRLNYVVDFPFPDETQREEIWRTMFPKDTPMGEDIDFGFLARQFSFAGGNIKNAALTAAFLAAADGGKVQMPHLIQGVAREWQKLGRLPSSADFRQYYPLLEGEPSRSKRQNGVVSGKTE